MKIRIQGQAIVQFDQVKEMTLAQFRELQDSLGRGDITEVEAWVDIADMDAIEFDAVDIDVSKVKAGKPCK